MESSSILGLNEKAMTMIHVRLTPSRMNSTFYFYKRNVCFLHTLEGRGGGGSVHNQGLEKINLEPFFFSASKDSYRWIGWILWFRCIGNLWVTLQDKRYKLSCIRCVSWVGWVVFNCDDIVREKKYTGWFLATLVALHLTPMSEWVGRW